MTMAFKSFQLLISFMNNFESTFDASISVSFEKSFNKCFVGFYYILNLLNLMYCVGFIVKNLDVKYFVIHDKRINNVISTQFYRNINFNFILIVPSTIKSISFQGNS